MSGTIEIRGRDELDMLIEKLWETRRSWASMLADGSPFEQIELHREDGTAIRIRILAPISGVKGALRKTH